MSDFHSDNFNGSSNNGGGLYQVACSIVHNSPSPITNDRFHPQRRHSAISHAYPGMLITLMVMGSKLNNNKIKKLIEKKKTNKQHKQQPQ